MNFELAWGSVAGRDHYITGKNGHDAVQVTEVSDGFIGIVCDGCSSGEHSEVGAKFAVNALTKNIKVALEYFDIDTDDFWHHTHSSLLFDIENAARIMGSVNFIPKYFLFTVIGVIKNKDKMAFFALGDGHIFINGVPETWGPAQYPNNAPPYVAYALEVYPQSIFSLKELEFHRFNLPAVSVNSFLIGTDGLDDLITKEGKSLPWAPDKVVEPLSDFWETNIYFENPFALGRRLTVLNGGVFKQDTATGREYKYKSLLRDDTTMITGRKINEEVAEDEVLT